MHKLPTQWKCVFVLCLMKRLQGDDDDGVKDNLKVCLCALVCLCVRAQASSSHAIIILCGVCTGRTALTPPSPLCGTISSLCAQGCNSHNGNYVFCRADWQVGLWREAKRRRRKEEAGEQGGGLTWWCTTAGCVACVWSCREQEGNE